MKIWIVVQFYMKLFLYKSSEFETDKRYKDVRK